MTRDLEVGPRRRSILSFVLVAAAAAWAGCRGPAAPARPLAPDALLADVRAERARTRDEAARRFTLADATASLRRGNPEVLRARAAWRTACAVAAVPTPLDNPRITAGPLLVGVNDVLSSAAVGAIGALGWAVPLSRRRALQDDLNAVRAAEAFAEVAAVERRVYLQLRRAWLETTLHTAVLDARRDLLATARAAQEAIGRALDAGQAGALDAGLVALEGAAFEAETVVAEEDLGVSRGRLAALVGVATDDLPAPAAALPTLAPAPPPQERLEDVALEGHPDLAVIRARYLVAEKELRLEAARSVPDLELGVDVEDEVEDAKIALPLGIEIPLFDRNQVGIAEALARRDEQREQFRAALVEILSAADGARVRVLTRGRVLALVERQMAEARAMQETVETVVLQAGALDTTRRLEVLRTTRRVQIDLLEARASLYEAWSDLEQAVGAPLMRFADEPACGGPVASQGRSR